MSNFAPRKRWFLCAALVGSWLTGCAGQLVDTSSPDSIEAARVRKPDLSCKRPSSGPSPLRRLSHTEYDNTVRDLLGDTSKPSLGFPEDQREGLFDNAVTTLTASQLLSEKYQDAAATLAENAVKQLTSLVNCNTASQGEAACAAAFISRFGRRAYRRPLSADEKSRLSALYSALRGPSDFSTAIQGVVQALLVSPHFLFRPEFGGGAGETPGSIRVSSYEMASRLSYLIWSSMPDDALLDKAERGELESPEQIAEQARAMLADPKARSAVGAFYRQWLHLDAVSGISKDPAVYAGVDEALKVSMEQETQTFIDHVLWEDDGKLRTLLSAPYSFVNASLASLYGISGVAGTALRKVTLDPAQRAGVLTHASLLAIHAKPNQSSPIKRGEFVRVRMLCHPLTVPAIPIPELAPVQPGLTTRQRFAEHTNNPACVGCHRLIDGVGFGFEQYDGIGRWRTLDQGIAVDASGDVVDAQDASGPFNGAVELAHRLAQSSQVRDCVPEQWFKYVHGRAATAEDACSLASLRQRFADSDGDLRDLIIGLTQTETFLTYSQPK